MAVTMETLEARPAVVVPWLLQSMQLLRAHVVLAPDTAAERKTKQNKVTFWGLHGPAWLGGNETP